MQKNEKFEKEKRCDSKYWVGVLYPENMRPDWEIKIGDLLQLPYAYCKHTRDKDTKSEHRKDHVHIVVAFPNTTTYNHAMRTYNSLSADGKKALNKIEPVINIRHVYDYLIHDTEACKKEGKELYDPSERITGNNFDVGAYEQLETAEKRQIRKTLADDIIRHGIYNYADLYVYVTQKYDERYETVMLENYGIFSKLCDGNYQKLQQGRLKNDFGKSLDFAKPQSAKSPTCCPECGSINIKKSGKTKTESQRWACKDCGKTFIE